MPGISDEVRAATQRIAARARLVRIDETRLASIDPGPAPGLDPELHFLEGTPEQVATYVCAMDAVNFGSGWWPTIAKREGMSGAMTMTAALTEQYRRRRAWTAADLRQLTTAEVAGTFGQPPEHELMQLYGHALRELGMWLGRGGPLRRIEDARGSGQRFARSAVDNMPLFEDRGLYKRAQILVHDLALAGVAQWVDLDRLTIFADNLVPHVLRVEGVLVYDARLAARVDAEDLLAEGGSEREIRGCAVHACELLAQRSGVPPRLLDGWLWNRGQEPRFKALPRHRCRTTAY
jgi:hypothetical protein